MALFSHSASRANEPAVHFHLLTANLVCEADGVWNALDARELYRCQASVNCQFLGALAARLVSGGYALTSRPDECAFEIGDMPDSDLRRVLGTRRRQIIQRMPKRRLAGKGRRVLTDLLALRTRSEKRVDSETVIAESTWTRLGLAVQAAVQRCVGAARNRASRQIPVPTALDDFGEACKKVLTNQWLATDVHVVRAVSEKYWGRPFDVEQWVAALASETCGWLRVAPCLYGRQAEVYALRDLQHLHVSFVIARTGVADIPQHLVKPKNVFRLSACVSSTSSLVAGDLANVTSGEIIWLDLSEPCCWRPSALIAITRAVRSGGGKVVFVLRKSDSVIDVWAARLLQNGGEEILIDRTSPVRGSDLRIHRVVTPSQRVTFAVEVPDDSAKALVAYVARQFAAQERRSVYIPETAVALGIGSGIRDELWRIGALAGPAKQISQLVDFSTPLQSPDITGIVLVVAQNFRGLRRGARLLVTATAPDGTVTGRCEDGSDHQLPPDGAKRFRAYWRRSLPLGPGDCIRFTRPVRNSAGVRFSPDRIYVVAEVDETGAIGLTNRARLAAGFGHWEYAYACANPARFGTAGAVLPTRCVWQTPEPDLRNLVSHFSEVVLFGTQDVFEIARRLRVDLRQVTVLHEAIGQTSRIIGKPASSEREQANRPAPMDSLNGVGFARE